MSQDDKLADRVRELLSATTNNITEKKMFGGLCFMVNDKMCAGVKPGRLMVRIDPARCDQALEDESGATVMVHGGREMKGFIFIEEEVLKTKKQLQHWIKMALEFNVIAKPSKKK